MLSHDAPPGTLIIQRHVRSPNDMNDIEAAITRQLGGEGHRCAFLRSTNYIRVRLAALYPRYATAPDAAPPDADTAWPPLWTAYADGLCVSLTRDGRGATVSVRSVQPFVFADPLADPLAAPEASPPASPRRQRRRNQTEGGAASDITTP